MTQNYHFIKLLIFNFEYFFSRVIIKMMNSKYLFTKFRTTRKYFVFLIFQLLLSLGVVIMALIEPLKFKSSLTLVAEIIVALCISLDMYIILNQVS